MGMTTQPIDSLLPLARSWNYPAEVKLNSTHFKFYGYDQYQRCYNFENISETNEALEFDIMGSPNSPIVNLACVIKNWKGSNANIEIHGKNAVQGVDYKIGYLPELDTHNLVVWINITSSSEVNVKIKYSNQ